jgi:hypothetical protein
LENVDDAVTFAQLDYDKEKVKLMVGEEEMDNPLVLLEAVKEEVEEEKPAEEGSGEAAPVTAVEEKTE